ncbi:MAG: hypothetical protein Q8P48_07385 [Deltaproteobacteria bacterium]|nr:hypothetical protein [Deltaproteobacteria bacterium]
MHQVDELKTAAGDGHANGNQTEPSKVMFVPEQQARVQELIDEAYRKAYAKAQRSRGGEEVERLKAEVGKLREERKTAAILRAVSKHSVVDAEEVADLMKERVRMDEDGNFSVIGESGAVRVNNSGHPMSVDEYIGHWLSERPHHLRAAGPSGAGSRGAMFGGHASVRYNLTDPAVWRSMPREDLDRLLSEGISVQGNTGQSYTFKDVKNPFLEARRRKLHAGGAR